MVRKSLYIILLVWLLQAACSKLVSSTYSSPAPYVFPGLKELVANNNGTYLLRWTAVPSTDPATYKVFERTSSGQYDFARPLATDLKEVTYTTANLFGQETRCYIVRAQVPTTNYSEQNTVEKCTSQITFAGLQELRSNGDGSYLLRWNAVSADQVTYKIFERSSSGKYDFERPLATDLKEVTYTTANLFGLETRCYIVRALVTNTAHNEQNTVEKCTDRVILPGLENFRGCLKVTPEGMRAAIIEFEFPTSASKINLYRDKSLVFSGDSPNVSVYRDAGLEPGKEYKYSCEAIVNGRPLTGSQAITATTTGLSSFEGCVSGVALSSTQIRIDYAVPTGAQSFEILRDGVSAFSASANSAGKSGYTEITGLQEGYTYIFRCTANLDGVAVDGTKELTLSTLNFNPPLFSGGKSATESTPGSVVLTWDPATGPKTSKYKIFATLGGTIDWTIATKETDDLTFSTIIESLGAQLPYVFGVRACTKSGVCDTNVTTKAVTTASRGVAPSTIGITQARASNGTVYLTAPWSASNGALARRLVYTRIVSDASTPVSLSLSDYTLAKEEIIASANVTTPPSEITVSPIQESTPYHFLLIDESPASGTQAALSTPLTANRVFYFKPGKQTPPAFGGVAQVTAGTPADTTIVLNFVAIAREGTNDPGANSGTSYYDLYLNSAPFASAQPNVTNACNAATPYATYPAGSSLAPGDRNLTVTGLSPRTTYSVCLKARDSVGNVSTSSSAILITTRDITPPVFSGIQGLERNIDNGNLRVNWNPASDADLGAYRVDLWMCTNAQFAASDNACKPPSAGGTATVVSRMRTATTSANLASTEITSQEFALGNYKSIFVMASACDDAHLISGGQDNCSVHATSGAKVMTLTEVAPPAGFPGTASEQLFVTDAEGQVVVKWIAPDGGFTPDFAAFRIYTTNSDGTNLVLNTTVSCTSPGTGCPTEGRVTGLDPYRTYGFYVAGISPAGNSTMNYLTPTTNYTKYKRTTDTTPPVFSSSLAVTGSVNPILAWQAATDNQYSAEPGKILRYKVYKKAGSTFANPLTPAVDGTLLNVSGGFTISSNNATLSYTDTSVTEGNWYFAVCAFDSSGNQSCDGRVQAIYLNDSTPPSLNSLVITRIGTAKTWSLNWQMKDNISVTRVRVYEKLSTATGSGTACTDTIDPNAAEDYNATTKLGMHLAKDYSASTQAGTYTADSWTARSGPQNLDRCVTYLVRVNDSSGNEATAFASTYSQNIVTLSAISRAEGSSSGGRTVLISGTGFSVPTVTIGGNACTAVTVISGTVKLSCLTPTGSVGAQNVVVSNEDGSSASLTNGYTYKDTSSGNSDICNLSAWGAGDFAGGDGSSGNPYLICNPTHFDKIRLTAPINYFNGGKYYKLADHLDFSSYNTDAANPTFYPIGCSSAGCVSSAAAFAALYLDGNNYTIANFTYSNNAFNYVGLFAGFNFGSVKQLNLLNFNLRGGTGVGMLFGGFAGATGGNILLVQDVTASGSVTGTSIGGIGGAAADNGQSYTNYNRVAVTATLNGTTAGGIMGAPQAATCSYCATKVTLNNATSNSGGLFGVANQSFGALSISYSSASITWTASTATTTLSYAGGLIGSIPSAGWNTAITIDRSSAKLSTSNLAAITVNGLGGLIGYSACAPLTITKSYAVGTIDASMTATGVGFSGFVFQTGNNLPTNTTYIADSYSDVQTNLSSYGMVFSAINASTTGQNITLVRTYSTQNGSVGLLTRTMNSGVLTTGSITSSFWLYDPSNPTPRAGTATGWNTTDNLTVDAGSKALTHAEMGTQSSFSSQGWDFSSGSPVWMMPANGGPPQLIGVPTPP